MKTTIVAEIGINANRDLDTAQKLIFKAKEAGADFVKFQLWQSKTFNLEPYRFSEASIWHTLQYAKQAEIGWFCTPFDIPSAEYLAELNMEIWKIPSNPAVVKRIDVMEKIFELADGKKIFFSTGKSSMKELEMFSEIASYKSNITWMHCVSKYPCPVEDMNLSRLESLKHVEIMRTERLNFKELPADQFPSVISGRIPGDSIGLSDHSLSIAVPVAAVALGASVIEKHITLDQGQDGPDHKASIEPEEFELMVTLIREAEVAL